MRSSRIRKANPQDDGINSSSLTMGEEKNKKMGESHDEEVTLLLQYFRGRPTTSFPIFFFFLKTWSNIINICIPNQTPQPTGQQLPPTLVNTNRTIGAGGGFAEVTFSANNGQRIRITLTGSSSMMEPYGSLEYPDGMTSIYTPDLGSSLNGVNTSELILTQSGTYTYVIFDGSNIGGQVNVKIEMI